MATVGKIHHAIPSARPVRGPSITLGVVPGESCLIAAASGFPFSDSNPFVSLQNELCKLTPSRRRV